MLSVDYIARSVKPFSAVRQQPALYLGAFGYDAVYVVYLAVKMIVLLYGIEIRCAAEGIYGIKVSCISPEVLVVSYAVAVNSESVVISDSVILSPKR